MTDPAQTSGAHTNAIEALRLLSAPTSVAIVGGSADATKIAGRAVKYLARGAFAGERFLVNPSRPAVEGYESVARIEELPHRPDVAFVALGTAGAIEAVRQLDAIATPVAVVLAAGFAESGAEGIALQAELAEAAGHTRLLGPNTLGAVNLTDGVLICASDSLETPALAAGSVSVASQSGGVMSSLLSRATGRGIGLSKLFATGNEVDLDVADCIAFLATDAATSVIACYLETVRHPRRFLDAAAIADAAGKPVVCYKVGRSEDGARAAVSHTGALAGSDRVYDALFEQAGVRRVSRFEELLEIPAALATGKRMAGRRIGVLTTTGGVGTLLADACGDRGLTLPAPARSLVERFVELFPAGSIDLAHNPVDLTLAGIRPEVIEPVIGEITSNDSYDAIVVVLGASAVAQPRLVADPLIACAADPGSKPILAYVSPYLPEVVARLNQSGVPAFSAPESCAAALDALAPPVGPLPHAPLTAESVEGQPLNEHEAKALFSYYAIASPARVTAESPTELADRAATLSPPLALKLLAPDLAHKSEVGAVALGVAGSEVESRAAALAASVAEALPDLEVEGFLAEEMATGTEVLLGMTRDPALGPAILLGSGGIAAELVDDTVVALVPVDLARAQAMIERLRLAPLLHGAGGRPRADVDALARAIVAFSDMVCDLGEQLLDTEINPLVVLAEGQGVLALDATLRYVKPKPLSERWS